MTLILSNHKPTQSSRLNDNSFTSFEPNPLFTPVCTAVLKIQYGLQYVQVGPCRIPLNTLHTHRSDSSVTRRVDSRSYQQDRPQSTIYPCAGTCNCLNLTLPALFSLPTVLQPEGLQVLVTKWKKPVKMWQTDWSAFCVCCYWLKILQFVVQQRLSQNSGPTPW